MHVSLLVLLSLSTAAAGADQTIYSTTSGLILATYPGTPVCRLSALRLLYYEKVLQYGTDRARNGLGERLAALGLTSLGGMQSCIHACIQRIARYALIFPPPHSGKWG